MMGWEGGRERRLFLRRAIIWSTRNTAYSTAIRKLDADEGKGSWDAAAERAKLCESLAALDSALSASSPGRPFSLFRTRSLYIPLGIPHVSFTAARWLLAASLLL